MDRKAGPSYLERNAVRETSLPDDRLPEDRQAQVPAASSASGCGASPDRGPLAFDELSQGQAEVQIEYHGQVYRLRATRNGKLILNK